MRVFIDTNLWGEYLYIQYPWIETTVDDLLEKDLVVSDILLVELWPVMPTGLGKIYEVLDNIRRRNLVLEHMLPEDIRVGLDIHEKYRAHQTKNLGIADLFHAAIAIRPEWTSFTRWIRDFCLWRAQRHHRALLYTT